MDNMKKSVYIPKEGDVLSSINYKSLPDGDFLVTKEGPLKDVFSYAKKMVIGFWILAGLVIIKLKVKLI